MVAVCFLLLIAVSMFLLYRERLFNNLIIFFVCLALLILIFDLRLICLPYVTLDYTDFLAKWVNYFRLNGGFAAIKESIGNYNVPYLYFLAAFSYIPVNDLYLIKILSIAFDVVLAFAGLKIVSLFTESKTKKLLCFFLIMILPSVVLNGSLWAQCDSIYAAFALLSIYFILSGRPVLSMVMAALSLGFKMQAVFFMPVFFVFLYTKKLKLRHLPVFPLTYLLLVLPTVLAGRPFLETITLYFNQVDSVGSGLNYNSSSIFAFFYNIVNLKQAAMLGILAAFLLIAVIYAFAYIKRKKLTNEALLTIAVIFSIGVPFFLPHMHDRYFFLADILTLCFAIIYPKRAPLPVLVSFASLLGYHAYFKMRYLLPMSYGAAALILVLVVLLYDLCRMLSAKDDRLK